MVVVAVASWAVGPDSGADSDFGVDLDFGGDFVEDFVCCFQTEFVLV